MGALAADALLPTLLAGLAGASSLFLTAAGLTVIFGVTRVVNFAHGSLTMLGAYLAWSLLARLPAGPGWLALGLLGAAAGTALLGALLEVALLRRLYRRPELFQLLATFGVVLVVQDAVPWLWGPAELTLPRPRWLRGAVEVAGARLPVWDLVLMAVGPLVLGLLWLGFHRTRWGVLVRAATLDRDMTAALGVDQRRLFTGVFALGAGLAGLGGALALPAGSANLQIDLAVIAEAFVVVVVGGLGSLPGAFLASLLIGLVQAFGVALFPRATLVLVFLLMALVLALRPHGLLGRPLAPAPAEAAPHEPPAPARAAAAWGLGLALAAAAPLAAGAYALAGLADAAVAVLFAASLHLMMGPGGMASFGHAAWFGIGAYATGLLALGGAWLPPVPFALTLLAAPVAAGLAAALVGGFVVRLSGVYLSMLTLAFAQVAWAVAFQWVEVTGGDNGLLGVWPPAWVRDPARLYWLTLALCAGAVWGLRRLLRAPFGHALRATRDAPDRAAAIGLDAPRLRQAAFALAGAGAGLAGALFAYGKGGVFPATISIAHSVEALVMVLLGGVHALSGPVAGALAYAGLHDLLLRATASWRLGLGAAIVALVLAFPDGLAGVARRLRGGRPA